MLYADIINDQMLMDYRLSSFYFSLSPYLDSLGLHSNTKLRVFPDSALDNVGDVLQCRGKVLQPVQINISCMNLVLTKNLSTY